MIQSRTAFFFFLGFLPFILFCNATEHQPWLGNVYEFEWRSSLKFQGFNRISSDSELKKYSSDDLFLSTSLANVLPDPQLGGELEIIQAWTRKQKGCTDQIKLTGRYAYWDDVAGDPLSITFGLSYIQGFHRSLKDLSSFHHGLYESEIFGSIGKEKSLGTVWISRWWMMGALGIAERGSPWLKFHANFEKRFGEQHELKTFFHSLWGLGGGRLHPNHFSGYGSVQHQSIDLGLRYTYLIEFFGSASLEYSYRIYARNFPTYTHQVLAQVLYTFGL